MSPRSAGGPAPLVAKRDGLGPSAALCSAALACLLSATALARDVGGPDRDLPCNDLCRAWLSWHPDDRSVARPASQGQPEPNLEGHGRTARRGPILAAVPPRSHAAMQAAAAERPGREARHLGRDDGAAVVPRAPSAPRVVPLRQAARVSTPSKSVGGSAGGPPGPGRILAGIGASGDSAMDRLRADADAAIMARPLYQPLGVADAPRDGPETPERSAEAVAEPQAPASVTARANAGGDRDRADEPPAPALNGPEPGAVPPSPPPTGVPAARPDAMQAAGAPSPVRRARAGLAPAPALPASDLERLDEVGLEVSLAAPAPPGASALPAVPARPTAWMLLLGGLAVLSLVGVRRRPVKGRHERPA